MDVRQRVGKNLKRLRHETGWSQEEFAFECGIHRTYISGLERGVRNPTILVLEKIAKSLGVPASVLLEDIPRARKTR
jgi:transcriptional regulator with XRE-family HTH domain